MKHVLERLQQGGVLFDGAMGTMLIAKGLQTGRPPEEWNHLHPRIVRDVHLSYLEAGAEVITTNTFGATPSRLEGYGLGDRIGELSKAGVDLARQAVTEFETAPIGHTKNLEAARSGPFSKRTRFIALSVGPTGKMLPPVGTADEGAMRDEFAGQLAATGSGYDLVVIETMYDLREALIALDAAKKSASSPIVVTMTYGKNPRGYYTIMGDEAARTARRLADAGADGLGANCTVASADMIDIARILRETTDLPVICQPNAGQPRVKGGIPVYGQTAEDFARDARTLFKMGINAVGGCCGTTPAFIEAVRAGMVEH